jgi:hypothetical protein
MLFNPYENRIYLKFGIEYRYSFNFTRICIFDYGHVLYMINRDFILKYKISKDNYKEILNEL